MKNVRNTPILSELESLFEEVVMGNNENSDFILTIRFFVKVVTRFCHPKCFFMIIFIITLSHPASDLERQLVLAVSH